MSIYRTLTFFAVVFFVVGCGSIKQSSRIETNAYSHNGQFVAGPGDIVLKVIKEENMPNAAGKADVFGRKRPTGTTVVVYTGYGDGRAHFVRRDVDIYSSKTTLNSSPIVINNTSKTYHSGSIGGSHYSGTATTQRMPIFLPPNTPADRVSNIRDSELAITVGREDSYAFVSGAVIKVFSADEQKVVFTLEQLKK